MLKGQGSPDLLTILDSLIGDMNTIRTHANALGVSLIATLLKLDADAGVTDTNYTSLNPAPVAMAALNTIASSGF